MLIYRVENSQGFGMYSTYPGFIGGGGWHPIPEQDSLLMRNLGGKKISGLHFGFSSLTQLEKWVVGAKTRNSLHEEGHRIHVYECVEAYEGEAQAVFRKETAKLTSVISLLTF